MGIHEVSRVTFVAPVKVGTVELPAGEYVVRHTMVGHAHVMVLQRVHLKDEFEVKCTLVPLTHKADKDQSIYFIRRTQRETLEQRRTLQAFSFPRRDCQARFLESGPHRTDCDRSPRCPGGVLKVGRIHNRL
jgi:hypothetical protein